MPFYALWYLVDDAGRLIGDGARAGSRAFAARIPWRQWTILTVSFLPALGFFLWYNAARFGSPLESGYGLATLPDWLAARRALGLFSTVHLGMNIDLLVFHLPVQIPEFPWFRPDGNGMSILFTSPGLLLAVRADWRAPRTWLLAGAALLVLIPSLLYYGGGWLQYGYRYALDSIPFAWRCARSRPHASGSIRSSGCSSCSASWSTRRACTGPTTCKAVCQAVGGPPGGPSIGCSCNNFANRCTIRR